MSETAAPPQPPPPPQPQPPLCEQLKDEGNAAFKRKDFASAESLYSRALALDPEDTDLRATLLTNRSNALSALGRHEPSLADAEAALQLSPASAKAFFRKGAALAALGRSEEAEAVYHAAAGRCEGSEGLFRSLLRKLRAKRGAKRGVPAALYPDEPGVNASPAEVERRAAEKNIKELREKLAGGRGEDAALMNGLFARLLDARQFRQIVYRSADLPKDSPLPKTFQELMAKDVYVEALQALFPRIRAKADSVLANVKAKAAAENQFMDPAMERMLRPQILNEAFAHQVVDMIHEVNRKQNAILAASADMTASADVEEADFDQVPPEALAELLDDSRGWCVLDGFLDDADGEWQALLRADVEDAIESGLLLHRDVASTSKRELLGAAPGSANMGCSSCWLTLAQVEESFVGLHELITRIFALPHELNKKRPGLRLARPAANNVLLLAVGPLTADAPNEAGLEYTGYEARYDGSQGADNNGYKLSAVYHFNPGWEPGQGGRLMLRSGASEAAGGATEAAAAATPAVAVEPRGDRLVLYRSRLVENAVEPLRCPAPARFSVSVFVNGPPQPPHW